MHRLYLVPTLNINFVIVLVPALLTIALAFCSWDGISAPSFSGLDNFRALFGDSVFWSALSVTCLDEVQVRLPPQSGPPTQFRETTAMGHIQTSHRPT
jgi:hypothetical protein